MCWWRWSGSCPIDASSTSSTARHPEPCPVTEGPSGTPKASPRTAKDTAGGTQSIERSILLDQLVVDRLCVKFPLHIEIEHRVDEFPRRAVAVFGNVMDDHRWGGKICNAVAIGNQ